MGLRVAKKGECFSLCTHVMQRMRCAYTPSNGAPACTRQANGLYKSSSCTVSTQGWDFNVIRDAIGYKACETNQCSSCKSQCQSKETCDAANVFPHDMGCVCTKK